MEGQIPVMTPAGVTFKDGKSLYKTLTAEYLKESEVTRALYCKFYRSFKEATKS